MSDSPLPDLTAQPIDIQHDTEPENDHGIARRIPHLGHALLFFSIAFTCIFLAGGVAMAFVHVTPQDTAASHPFANALAQLAAYAATFLIAVPLFPSLWTVTFWQGIHWTWRQAKLHWWKLLLLGAALSLCAQLADTLLVKSPVDSDVRLLFKTPLSSWLTVLLGTLVPGFVEEVAFRGFLMPALATAYDWLALDRTPAGLQRWERTTEHTRAGWIFGAVIASIPFAALHGGQLHGAKVPLAVIFVASLAFSAVRIRFRSVAAAALVHIAYDGLIFAEIVVSTGGLRHMDKLTG